MTRLGIPIRPATGETCPHTCVTWWLVIESLETCNSVYVAALNVTSDQAGP